ncbi:dienelactone hydrolase endo-1,3,1,4-beta-D-glucanase [Mycena vitilis]|nr:dienelactone hydrolase endo-1,3,1,4-beta-D-glucanase [Mycena vitilis]
MSLCANCFRGVTHEGTPEGKVSELGGVRCYIATPSVDYPKDKAVLLLPDALGLEYLNTKLLADDYARNGFKTVVPDYFNGSPAPLEVIDPGAAPVDWDVWVLDHGPEQTRPPLDAVIGALKADGVTEFAASGYCFGGRYTFDLAFDRVIKVAIIAHPGLLKTPEDLEACGIAISSLSSPSTLLTTCATAPLLINGCTYDKPFPPAAQEQADAILGGGKFAPGYKRMYWEGMEHGFAVKGDLADTKRPPQAAKEGAFEATVEWLLQYL